MALVGDQEYIYVVIDDCTHTAYTLPLHLSGNMVSEELLQGALMFICKDISHIW